jgi:hypothetical protein
MALIDSEELAGKNIGNDEPENTPEPEVKLEEEKKVEVPDKYRGKSLDDIIKMHQEAEKLIGKQAQEVGEVRKLADDLLKQQLSTTQQATTKEETEVDFFEDPKKAVLNAVEKHPDVLAAKEAALRLKRMEAQAKLQAKHPDLADIVQNSEFVEWVKASPTRMKLYTEADTQFDTEAADELLSTFKELKTIRQKQSKQDGDAVLQQNMKAAAVDTGGTGESSKKVYRRADLIRLRMTDPARYEALSEEIMRAYAENRVK